MNICFKNLTVIFIYSLSNAMSMRDAETGRLVWMKKDWPALTNEVIDSKLPRAACRNSWGASSRCLLIFLFLVIPFTVHLPANILGLRAITRELNFTSPNLLSNFHVVQTFTLFDQLVEGNYLVQIICTYSPRLQCVLNLLSLLSQLSYSSRVEVSLRLRDSRIDEHLGKHDRCS